MHDNTEVFERRAAMADEEAKRAPTPNLKQSWEEIARQWRDIAKPVLKRKRPDRSRAVLTRGLGSEASRPGLARDR